MARVLYWNIQQFGINKINNPSRKRQRGSTLSGQTASASRRNYILATIATNPPDIIVVVETSTGAGASGTLITAGGQQGALDLLNRIRAVAALGPNWMLVPPLILGTGGVTEGISVYYNSAALNFTGPWGWQGGPNPSNPVAAIGPGNLVNYTAPWNNCLPLGNTPAGANLINPNIPYRRLAGQWQFRIPIGPVRLALNFPNNFNRTPFLTTFWDAANARTIKLLAFHASPKKNQAARGTNQLSHIQEITNLAANEVGVIVGDFNVDIFNAHFEPIAYDNLTAAGYTRQINPTANQWPDKGYVCTMNRSAKNARPWENDGYPGYGYVIKDTYSSVDNILTRYGGVAAGGPATNITIVNRVTGSRYNRVIPTPGIAPIGHYNYATGMQRIIGGPTAGLPSALPLPPNGPTGNGGYTRGNIGALSRFKGWDNYGVVRSTSDHMALIIDV